jgi:hypothetical protein
MRDLGALGDEMTPVLRDLESAAPDLNRFLLELGPFSRNAVPAIETLGEATDVGRPALRAARPLVNDLRRFAADARPVSANLDELTQSLDKTGGIERAMDYIFFQTTSVNGFDGVSHYLRAALIANLCSVYVTRPTPGCNANYTETRSIRASGSGRIDPHLARTRRALSNPRPVGSSRPSRGRGLTGGGLVKRLLGLEDPRIRAQREAYKRRIRENARRPASAGRRGAPDEAALDYLLGNDR